MAWTRRAALAFLLLTPPAVAAQAPSSSADRPRVVVAELDGIIHPVSAEYLREVIDEADTSDAALVVVVLRTPGGLLDSTRDIVMPTIGVIQGGATVDLDPEELPVRDAHGTNLQGQMPVPGRYFDYEIPPHTQPLELPVSVTNAPAGGAMVQLVQPRLWPLPIGGQ